MRKFFKNDLGATTVEYALIAGIMSVCLLVGMALVTDGLTSAFNYVDTVALK